MGRDDDLGELLIQGLGEALAYERGELAARSRVRTMTARQAVVAPPPASRAAPANRAGPTAPTPARGS
jgi:hypothetical protein